MFRLGCAGALLSVTTAARAQSVTVGVLGGLNCLPFSCLNGFGLTRYQQVYAAQAFNTIGGPLAITSVGFLAEAGNPTGMRPGTYLVRLSTTLRPVGGLDTLLASNVGADAATFSNTFVGLGATGFVGTTPFLYDPARGNLLLDILVYDQSPLPARTAAFASGVRTPLTSRASGESTRSYVLASADDIGLVTVFGYGPLSTVPEPGTWALVGVGLVGVGFTGAARARVGRQAAG